jgi:hypothetical protein
MKPLLLLALLSLSLPALADRLPLPASTPASYKTECGSCHLAYPPALLGAADWRRILSGLKDHFGSDAEPSPAQKQEIATFLERNAGNTGKLGNAGEPPRISNTARFVRKHDEIPKRFWRDPRVKSAANCEACHTHAADGRYSEHDIAIPELRE